MLHKDRFLATIHYEKTDRPASWLGLPVAGSEPALKKYFHVSSVLELKQLLDDDIFPIEVPYHYPPSNHIACAFDFAKKKHLDRPDDRTLTTPGFFEDYSDPDDVEKFNWPDPSKYLDREESRRLAKAAGDDYVRMGILWSAHFQDACSAFGMEHALMVMLAPQALAEPLEVARRLTQMLQQRSFPVFAVWMGGRDVAAAVQHLNDAGIAEWS